MLVENKKMYVGVWLIFFLCVIIYNIGIFSIYFNIIIGLFYMKKLMNIIKFI